MKKYDATVKELKADIAELEKNFARTSKDLDEVTRIKAKELLKNTENTINKSIEKVGAAIKDIQDEEKLNDLLDKIKAKAKEATDYTLEKIKVLSDSEKKTDIDKLHDDIMAEFDKLKDTDTYKATKVLVKEGYDKINEFLKKPEVQEAIKKAKKTTINVAEKGVESLKKVLEDKPTSNKKTTTKKSTKKTATKKPAAKKATTKKTTKKAAE